MKESKRIGLVIADRSPVVVADGASVTMIPALVFPTDGAS